MLRGGELVAVFHSRPKWPPVTPQWERCGGRSLGGETAVLDFCGGLGTQNPHPVANNETRMGHPHISFTLAIG
jgi:hypothetical protein